MKCRNFTYFGHGSELECAKTQGGCWFCEIYDRHKPVVDFNPNDMHKLILFPFLTAIILVYSSCGERRTDVVDRLVSNIIEGRSIIGEWQGILMFIEDDSLVSLEILATFDSTNRAMLKIDTTYLKGRYFVWERKLFFDADFYSPDSLITGYISYYPNINAKEYIEKNTSIKFDYKPFNKNTIILFSNDFNGNLFLKRIKKRLPKSTSAP